MDWMKLPERGVAIALSPIARADYARFAQETKRTIPKQPGLPGDPVTGISAKEANAFAEWLSQREKRRYRLPILEEMQAFADYAHDKLELRPSASGWEYGTAPGGHGSVSEWLDCSPDLLDNHGRLHCIVHWPWLSTAHGLEERGALSDDRYSFVTFRLVRADETGR